MFRLKKWLWTNIMTIRGADRAYTKYLQHFEDYQANKSNSELQKELNVTAMTKDEFLKVWSANKKSKSGCCS